MNTITRPDSIIKLASIEASNDATIDFDTSIDFSVFPYYRFLLNNIVLQTDQRDLWLRVALGGSILSLSNYYWSAALKHGVSPIDKSGSAVNHINLTGGTTTTDKPGNAAQESINGEIVIYDPGETNRHKLIRYNVLYNATDIVETLVLGIGAYRLLGEALTQVQFLAESDNITSGKFTLYGVR